MMRMFRAAAAITALGLALAGCGRSETYRYKLTLSVETDAGVKTASTIVEVRHAGVSFPASGVVASVRGEALYLDLGPGHRPLIALLTREFRPRQTESGSRWEENRPTVLLARLYEGPRRIHDLLDTVSRFSRHRGPRPITTADLPDLVSFEDAQNPKSVIEVDPDNLSAALDQTVRWVAMTLEVTTEPLTTGIEKRLPWLSGFEGSLAHPGRRGGIRTSNELAARLGLWNFKQGGR